MFKIISNKKRDVQRYILLIPLVLVLMTANSFAEQKAQSPAPNLKVIKSKNFTDEAKLQVMLKGDSDTLGNWNVGNIQKASDGKENLILDGKKIFEGYNLSRASMSDNGIVAVSSYHALHHQIDGDGSDAVYDKTTGKLAVAISSVWIIYPNGEKIKVTSDSIHASYPVISSSGRWLAFSAEFLDNRGLPSERKVYVISIEKGIAGSPVGLDIPSLGSTIPIKWEGNQLIVLSTQEESSYSYQITWVQVTSG